MRWNDFSLSWGRPLKSILAIFDKKKLTFNFHHLTSSNLRKSAFSKSDDSLRSSIQPQSLHLTASRTFSPLNKVEPSASLLAFLSSCSTLERFLSFSVFGNSAFSFLDVNFFSAIPHPFAIDPPVNLILQGCVELSYVGYRSMVDYEGPGTVDLLK